MRLNVSVEGPLDGSRSGKYFATGRLWAVLYDTELEALQHARAIFDRRIREKAMVICVSGVMK